MEGGGGTGRVRRKEGKEEESWPMGAESPFWVDISMSGLNTASREPNCKMQRKLSGPTMYSVLVQDAFAMAAGPAIIGKSLHSWEGSNLF